MTEEQKKAFEKFIHENYKTLPTGYSPLAKITWQAALTYASQSNPWQQAVVNACIQIEGVLDQDPVKTLENLKTWWTQQGQDEGIKRAFDYLECAAANTEDDRKSEILMDIAEDIIEFSGEYNQKWKEIIQLQAEFNEKLTAAKQQGRDELAAELRQQNPYAYFDEYTGLFLTHRDMEYRRTSNGYINWYAKFGKEHKNKLQLYVQPMPPADLQAENESLKKEIDALKAKLESVRGDVLEEAIKTCKEVAKECGEPGAAEICADRLDALKGK